jgi:hypothetical protein
MLEPKNWALFMPNDGSNFFDLKLISDKVVFGVIDNNKPIGYLVVTKNLKKEGESIIHSWNVLNDHPQNLTIAKSLLKKAIDWSKTNGFKTVSGQVQADIEVYPSHFKKLAIEGLGFETNIEKDLHFVRFEPYQNQFEQDLSENEELIPWNQISEKDITLIKEKTQNQTWKEYYHPVCENPCFHSSYSFLFKKGNDIMGWFLCELKPNQSCLIQHLWIYPEHRNFFDTAKLVRGCGNALLKQKIQTYFAHIRHSNLPVLKIFRKVLPVKKRYILSTWLKSI